MFDFDFEDLGEDAQEEQDKAAEAERQADQRRQKEEAMLRMCSFGVGIQTLRHKPVDRQLTVQSDVDEQPLSAKEASKETREDAQRLQRNANTLLGEYWHSLETPEEEQRRKQHLQMQKEQQEQRLQQHFREQEQQQQQLKLQQQRQRERQQQHLQLQQKKSDLDNYWAAVSEQPLPDYDALAEQVENAETATPDSAEVLTEEKAGDAEDGEDKRARMQAIEAALLAQIEEQERQEKEEQERQEKEEQERQEKEEQAREDVNSSGSLAGRWCEEAVAEKSQRSSSQERERWKRAYERSEAREQQEVEAGHSAASSSGTSGGVMHATVLETGAPRVRFEISGEHFTMHLPDSCIAPQDVVRVWEKEWGIAHAGRLRFAAPHGSDQKWLQRDDVLPAFPTVIRLEGLGTITSAVAIALRQRLADPSGVKKGQSPAGSSSKPQVNRPSRKPLSRKMPIAAPIPPEVAMQSCKEAGIPIGPLPEALANPGRGFMRGADPEQRRALVEMAKNGRFMRKPISN